MLTLSFIVISFSEDGDALKRMGCVEGGSLLAVTELEVDSTLLALSWIPSSARLAAVGTNTAGGQQYLSF